MRLARLLLPWPRAPLPQLAVTHSRRFQNHRRAVGDASLPRSCAWRHSCCRAPRVLRDVSPRQNSAMGPGTSTRRARAASVSLVASAGWRCALHALSTRCCCASRWRTRTAQLALAACGARRACGVCTCFRRPPRASSQDAAATAAPPLFVTRAHAASAATGACRCPSAVVPLPRARSWAVVAHVCPRWRSTFCRGGQRAVGGHMPHPCDQDGIA